MCRSIFSSRAIAALALATSLQAGAVPTVLYDQSDFGIGTGPEAGQLLSANDFVLAAPASIRGFKVWMKDGNAAFGGGDGVADGVFRSFSGILSWYFFADAVSPAAQAAGATQFVDAPIACRTFDGALWIFPSGQIGNKHPSQTMRVLCPLIHETKAENSDKIIVYAVNANRHDRVRCKAFFNHPFANVDPPAAVSKNTDTGNSAGVEDATLTIPGRTFLGGSHLLECTIPPKSNEDNFDGISRIGTYKSGVD